MYHTQYLHLQLEPKDKVCSALEPFSVDFSFAGGSLKNKSMVNQSITSPTATINPTELYGLTGITKLPIEIDVLISATNKFATGPNNVPNVYQQTSGFLCLFEHCKADIMKNELQKRHKDNTKDHSLTLWNH